MNNKRKVLVTGASGYIGRHVVRVLEKEDVSLIACDVVPYDFESSTKVIVKDIFLDDSEIFEKLGSPDICIHLAWRNGFQHNANSHMKELSSHYKFINNMIEKGLKHLSVMGTMHEIGYHEGEISSDTVCNPSSMYGIAKDALRRSSFLLKENKEDILLQWLRAFYIYGDDINNNSIFSKLLQANQRGETTFPFTTGKNEYDFIHVEELAKQIAAASLQREIDGIINCCSGKSVTLADKVEEFILEHKLNIKLEYGAYPDREYDSPGTWGNNAKISRIMKK